MDELLIWIAKLEDVPEPFRKFYKAASGEGAEGFVLQAKSVAGYSIDKVDSLKSSLAAEREKSKAAGKALAAFRDADGTLLDAVAARDAVKRMAELGDNADIDAKVRAAVEGKLGQIREKHVGEVRARDERIAKLAKNVEAQLVDQALLRALSDSTGERTAAINPRVLVSHLRDRVRAVENDKGDWEVHVLDEAGKRLITRKQGSEDFMGVDELADTVRADPGFKPFFAAKTVAGTTAATAAQGQLRLPQGALPGQQGQNGPSPTQRLAALYAQK